MMRALLIAVLVVVAFGCDDRRAVRIGVKNFTEQLVIYEVMTALLEQSDERTQKVPCGSPFRCQQLLRRGQIDVLVEYSGTAALFSGTESDDARAIAAAYRTLGVDVLKPLGFENNYVVVTKESFAEEAALGALGDLTKVGRLTWAVPPNYPKRPRDGMGALADRYGFEHDALTIATAGARIEALRDGRAQVAVLFSTDAELADAPVVILDDDDGFFADYRALIMVRSTENARVAKALAPLSLSTAEMRRANFAVDLEGFRPEEAAQALLTAKNLVDTERSARPSLRVSLPAGERTPRSSAAARRALRAAFPGRPVRFVDENDPLEAMTRGRTRLALVSGAEFFRRRRGSVETWRRVERAEALAVVERQLVHLVAKKGNTSFERIGATAGGRVGRLVLQRIGQRASRFASRETLLAEVASGKLDAAVVVAERGDPDVQRAILGGLVLRSLPERAMVDLPPYARAARLPMTLYAGQDEPVTTWALPVLLAGPARSLDTPGPAGISGGAMPITEGELSALMRSDAVLERPDPTLPIPWGRIASEDSGGDKNPLGAVLSLLAVLFAAWAVRLALS